MKQLFLFASMMLSVTACSQWEIGTYIDDSGEETGEVFAHQTAVGMFSSSATTNSKCTYFIEHNKDDRIFSITIYPYGRDIQESWYDDTFQEVKIKKPSGEVVTIEAFCFDGIIYFSEEDYTGLMTIIKSRGGYAMVMTHKTDGASALYQFAFNN